VTRVGGAHHVLGIEHLLSHLRDGQSAVLLGASGSQRSESHHEKVQTRERNHVHGQLAEIAVELTRETQTTGGSADSGRHQVVQVSVGRSGQLQGTEADIVQSLVIQSEALIGVLDQLVDGKGGVVRLHDGIGHLGGRNDREGGHHAIRILLTDLGDQKGSHSGSSSTTEGVGHLEALEAVARLSLLADNVKNGVDQLSTLSVVALGPIVSGSGLTEHEVIRAEKLTERTSTDRVHSSGLKIHQDSTRNVSATGGLVEINIDSLQLKIRITVVSSRRIDT
jgi:hypothetical protein